MKKDEIGLGGEHKVGCPKIGYEVFYSSPHSHLLCSMSEREVQSSKLLLLESLRTGVSPLARGGSSGGSSTPS